MKILLFIVLLVSLSTCFNFEKLRSLQQSGGTCNTPVITCNLDLGADCSINETYVGYCKNTLYSAYSYNVTTMAFTCSCKQKGSLGQACASDIDCANISSPYVKCVNSVCTSAKYLGVGETCTTNHSCYTESCVSGKCNESSMGCYSDNYCAYNFYCSQVGFSAGTCMQKKADGSACTKSSECGLSVECVGGKCTPSFSVASGQACSSITQCSGCLGCKFTNGTDGTCSSALSNTVTYGMACTDSANCTTGLMSCGCDTASKTKKCLIDNIVATLGDCKAAGDAYVACIKQNQCPMADISNALSFFTLAPPAEACSSKCKAQSDCVAKCYLDVVKAVQPSAASSLECYGTPTCASYTKAGCYGGSPPGPNPPGPNGPPGSNALTLTVTLLFALLAILF